MSLARTYDVRGVVGINVIRLIDVMIEPNYAHPDQPWAKSAAAGSATLYASPEFPNIGEHDLVFVTNNHVIANAKRLCANHPTWGDVRLTTEVIGGCLDRDIAVVVIRDIVSQVEKLRSLDQNASADKIEAWMEKIEPVPFYAESEPSNVVDRTTFIVGYPLNEDNQVITEGVISSIQLFDVSGNGSNERLLLQTDSATNHGNSGGACIAVFDTEPQLRYVGIPSMGIPTASNIAFVIPMSEVRMMVDAMLAHPQSRAQTPDGVFVNAEGPYLGLGLSFDKTHYTVQGVDQTVSPFATKLSAGDNIVGVNGSPVGDDGKFTVPWTNVCIPLQTMLKIAQLGTLTLNVRRDGELFDVSAEWNIVANMPVRYRNGALEPFEYETFGGFTLCELVMQHLQDPEIMNSSPFLCQMQMLRNRQMGRVIVVGKDPLVQSGVTVGWILCGVLTKLNECIPIETMDDFRRAFEMSLKDNAICLVFQTPTQQYVVFNDLKTIVEEQAERSESYNVRTTPVIAEALSML